LQASSIALSIVLSEVLAHVVEVSTKRLVPKLTSPGIQDAQPRGNVGQRSLYPRVAVGLVLRATLAAFASGEHRKAASYPAIDLTQKVEWI